MIPLFKPYMPELPDLDTIMHSGKLAYGEYTKQFEEKLREYFGTPYVMVVSSYSNAIQVVLTTLGIIYGDEIIASPMACLVSSQPYVANGMVVKWADIDPGRGTLLPESVEAQISSKTKAIVHNHYCGYPGYIDEINAIGRKYGIPVIDDGIECFGSEYRGKLIGNCGTDVTLFSLSAVRIPNCIEGGIVIFKTRDHFEKALLVRDCGIERQRFRDELGEINESCDISLIGYSATMSNINGYLGLMQMGHVERVLHLRRKQAKKWESELEGKEQYIPVVVDEGKPNYWVYGILTENKVNTIRHFREMGYYASGVHIRNDIYSVFGKHTVELPGVSRFSRSFVALPCGWWMHVDNDSQGHIFTK